MPQSKEKFYAESQMSTNPKLGTRKVLRGVVIHLKTHDLNCTAHYQSIRVDGTGVLLPSHPGYLTVVYTYSKSSVNPAHSLRIKVFYMMYMYVIASDMKKYKQNI